MANFETLLSPTGVLLFGRKLLDLKLDYKAPPSTPAQAKRSGVPGRFGDNLFLQKQLADKSACFARIYAFSYEGHNYDLPRPVIMLVHGDGIEPQGKTGQDAVAHDTDRSGVVSEDYHYNDDVRVWAYDQSDISMRIEVDSGSIADILLQSELAGDNRSYFSGADLRVRSGADLRMRSGADLRLRSGADMRMRGGRGD
jgi:hypothetical protein